MRLTAREWIDKLSAILGGGVVGHGEVRLSRSVSEIHEAPDAPNRASYVTAYDERVFSLDTMAKVQGFVQIVPTSYYDTIQVGWANRTVLLGAAKPILIIPGLLSPSEGPHAWTEIATSQGLALDKYPPILAETPHPYVFAGAGVDNPAVGSGSARLELPLTNMPFAVALTDTEEPASDTLCSLRVVMMSVRH